MGNRDDLINFISDMFDYYDKDVRGGAAKIYFNALKGFDMDELRRVYKIHVCDPDQGRFIPKISDFSRILKGTKKGMAEAAWSRACDSVIKIGPYQSIVFDDPLIHLALRDMGGWVKICSLTEKELDFKHHDFVRLYEMYAGQGEARNYEASLPGILELDGCGTGSPVLFGDDQKCIEVYKNGVSRKPGGFKFLDIGRMAAIKNDQRINSCEGKEPPKLKGCA